jgi:Pyridoxal-phosphate dependent enzyme
MNEIVDLKTLAATTTWGRGRVYDSIAETIGHTPLVRLNRLQKRADTLGHVLLKLEFFNPLSSVKDRIGVAMIDALDERHRFRHHEDQPISARGRYEREPDARIAGRGLDECRHIRSNLAFRVCATDLGLVILVWHAVRI